jgi:hypothetical protein
VLVLPFHLVSASRLGDGVLGRVRRWLIISCGIRAVELLPEGPIDFLSMR